MSGQTQSHNNMSGTIPTSSPPVVRPPFDLEEALFKIHPSHDTSTPSFTILQSSNACQDTTTHTLLPVLSSPLRKATSTLFCMRHRLFKTISNKCNFQKLTNTIGFLRFVRDVDNTNWKFNDGHVVSHQWMNVLWQRMLADKIASYVKKVRLELATKDVRIKLAREQCSLQHEEVKAYWEQKAADAWLNLGSSLSLRRKKTYSSLNALAFNPATQTQLGGSSDMDPEIAAEMSIFRDFKDDSTKPSAAKLAEWESTYGHWKQVYKNLNSEEDCDADTEVNAVSDDSSDDEEGRSVRSDAPDIEDVDIASDLDIDLDTEDDSADFGDDEAEDVQPNGERFMENAVNTDTASLVEDLAALKIKTGSKRKAVDNSEDQRPRKTNRPVKVPRASWGTKIKVKKSEVPGR